MMHQSWHANTDRYSKHLLHSDEFHTLDCTEDLPLHLALIEWNRVLSARILFLIGISGGEKEYGCEKLIHRFFSEKDDGMKTKDYGFKELHKLMAPQGLNFRILSTQSIENVLQFWVAEQRISHINTTRLGKNSIYNRCVNEDSAQKQRTNAMPGVCVEWIDFFRRKIDTEQLKLWIWMRMRMRSLSRSGVQVPGRDLCLS